MRYLNTLYITEHRAKVGYRRGSLIVTHPQSPQRIPIEGLDSVILFAGQLTTDAIAQCVRRRIRIAALTKSGRIRFVIGGPTTGNVHLRIGQYTASTAPDHTLNLCRITVAAKLRSTAHVLGRWSRDHRDLDIGTNLSRRATKVSECIQRLAEAPTPDHVRGIEGDAARLHFGGIARILNQGSLTYNKRTRRPPRDPVNAVLSFCYALLVTEESGACDTVGLDPQIGFLHRARSGRPSLALDLAEELRPLVDRFVVGLVRRRQLTLTHFTTTPGGAVYLNDNGRSTLLRHWEEHKNVEYPHPILQRNVGRWALPTVQATLMARHLRGDLDAYPPFVLDG